MTRTLTAKLILMVRLLFNLPNTLSNATCRTITGDVLETLEARHDWAKMTFTPELFKYVFTQMIPEIIVHSQNQDEEQVRGHYDRKLLRFLCWPQRSSVFTGGDDFYEWFVLLPWYLRCVSKCTSLLGSWVRAWFIRLAL
jgi:hypothetical protein